MILSEGQKNVYKKRKQYKIFFIIFIVFIFFFSFFITIAVSATCFDSKDRFEIKASAVDFPIEPDSIGYNCYPSINGCVYPSDQTKSVGDIWYQYASNEYEEEEGIFCTEKLSFQLYIKENGNWYVASSTSPIKIYSGANPQLAYGQEPSTCNAQNTPRATWRLQVNTDADCSFWEMAVVATYSGYSNSTYFNIIVDDDCVVLPHTPETFISGYSNDNIIIYHDATLLFLFLGVIIILELIWLL